MNLRIKTIFEAAQKLPPAEREELVDLIMTTIEHDPEIDTAWQEQARRRWHAHQASGVPAEDALEAVENVRLDLRVRDGA